SFFSGDPFPTDAGFSPDSAHYALVTDKGRLYLLAVPDARPRWNFQASSAPWGVSLCFSADSTTIIPMQVHGQQLQQIDVAAGQVRAKLRMPGFRVFYALNPANLNKPNRWRQNMLNRNMGEHLPLEERRASPPGWLQSWLEKLFGVTLSPDVVQD